jgi:hypothetical protein
MGIIATKGFEYRGVPKELIAVLRSANPRLQTFVETGTNIGATAFWAADLFKQVVTIEFAKELYDALDKNRPNIRFVLGDSSEMMPGLLAEHAIIYLDAHYSAGVTHKSYPLLKELGHINASPFHDLVIIVDDARCCSALWNDESYGELPEVVALLSHGGRRYVTLMDDMLVAVPRAMEEAVRGYYNARSKELWAQFVRDTRPGVVKQAAKKLLGR